MINLLQRVSSARVYIENEIYSQINTGILLFVGLEQKDEHLDFKIISSLIDKIIHYRIFADNQDKMNLSVADIQGDILIVSQFTLAAETQKGLRPGFSTSLIPALALPLYEKIVACFKEKYPLVKTGMFGANMQIELINDGPVTFLLKA